MTDCSEHQAGEMGWDELLALVRQKCGRIPAWDDPVLEFLSEEHRVQYFSNLVQIWLVKPVHSLRELNRQDPDFGFALLASVNAIPELLGKLRAGKTKNKRFYNKGLTWALGESIDGRDINAIFEAIRCAVAHHAVVEGNTDGPVASLNNEYDLPVNVVKDKSGRQIVCISPDKFAQSLVDGLHRYIYVLRYEAKTGGRKRLGKFNDYLKAVKGKP